MQRTARRRLVRGLIIVGVLGVSLLLSNLWVLAKARRHLVSAEEAKPAEIIVVLGAAVRKDRPSPVLERRLALAARLFHDHKAERILVSGRREPPYYDEPRAMRRWLEGEGVPSERIIEDPLGYRTYETFRRARDEYGVNNALVVTNAFHIARSVFLARNLGIDATGVVAEDEGFSLSSRLRFEVRETVARARAVFDVGL